MITLAVCQLALGVGDLDANAAAAAAAVAQAAARNARLVVLPELCDTGYVFRAAAEARALASPAGGTPRWAGGRHSPPSSAW